MTLHTRQSAWIGTHTTTLEMLGAPDTPPQPLGADIHLTRARRPSTDFYRYLYDGVGRDFAWVGRLLMPDTELEVLLADPRVGVHVLYIGGCPAGFFELDGRVHEQVELKYFGLFPPFHGKGLGRALLQHCLALAWAMKPRRVWLHTCDLDHPAALPTYTRAGFQIISEQMVYEPNPDWHLPR